MVYRHFILKGSLILLLLFASVCSTAWSADRSWVSIHYDPEVSAQTKQNVEVALNVIADMLTGYKLPLKDKVTVVVTADKESYLKALVFYGYSVESARLTAETSAGVSLNNRAIILLKGSTALHSNPREVFRVLPHELFHQIQSQFGRTRSAPWMTEAAPELFRILAQDRAGFNTVDTLIDAEAQAIYTANSLPSVRQLMNTEYTAFIALSRQGFPVYQMSLIMLYYLTKEEKFEPVLQYYRLLNNGLQPAVAFEAIFRRPQFVFAEEMDKVFAELKRSKPQ